MRSYCELAKASVFFAHSAIAALGLPLRDHPPLARALRWQTQTKPPRKAEVALDEFAAPRSFPHY